MNNYDLKPIFFSDHCMVSIRFRRKAFRVFRPKWNLWKFNMRFLKDEEFSKGVPLVLTKCLEYADMHVFAIWDSFKQKVKNLAIERGTIIAYENELERRELHKTLLLFHELECISPGVHSDYINDTKSYLQTFEAERYRGSVVRSRAKKFLLSEQPTKRSLDDERRYALSKKILEIPQDGLVINEPTLILKAFHDHYSNIFGKAIPTGNTEDVEN